VFLSSISTRVNGIRGSWRSFEDKRPGEDVRLLSSFLRNLKEKILLRFKTFIFTE
jgi:hypothetical protein